MVLNWKPGQYAKTHDAYFGTVFDDVNNAGRSTPLGVLASQDQDANTYDPAGLLVFGQTYYWRVDEVNEAATPTSWEGDVWSFSVPESVLVDDFEKYNDRCNRIFFGWVDGLGHNGPVPCGVAPSGGNGTGSTVGNVNTPFAEQTIVHGGNQSMPLAYDNTTGTTNYMFLAPRQGTAGPMTFGIVTTVAEKRFVAPRTLGTGWHHVAVVMDSATMNVKVYLDGTVVASGSTTVLPKDLGKTTQNWLGRSQWAADGYFDAMLDEVRIYNRGLSAGEVRYLVGERL